MIFTLVDGQGINTDDISQVSGLMTNHNYPVKDEDWFVRVTMKDKKKYRVSFVEWKKIRELTGGVPVLMENGVGDEIRELKKSVDSLINTVALV